MPIYEFRCTGCGELFELLFRPGEPSQGILCPHCGAEGGQRVLSRVSHNMGSEEGCQPRATTRCCAGGSCATITLPGHGH